MATTTIFADASDGYLESDSGTYSTTRDGSGFVSVVSGTDLTVGQDISTGPTYTIWETFFSFDTSTIGGTITSAVLEFYCTLKAFTAFTVEARLDDWGPALASGDWVPGADLASLPLVASLDTGSFGTVPGYQSFTVDTSQINAVGSTRIAVTASSTRLGTDTHEGWVTFSDSSTANKPRLVVTYTPTSGDATATPPTAVAVAAMGTPTTSTGSNATASPSAITTVAVPAAPVISAGSKALPVTVAVVGAVGVPTTSTGAGGGTWPGYADAYAGPTSTTNATATPAVAAATAAVGAPTTTAAKTATTTPATVAAVSAVAAPVVSTGTKAFPAAAVAIAAVGAPSTSTGTKALPVRVTAASAVTAPTISTGQKAMPTTVVAAAAVGNPTVAATSFATVTPTTIVAAAGVGSPSVTAARAAAATPSTVASAAMVAAPTVSAASNSTATPATAAAAAATGATSTPWTPDLLAGLRVWLKADTISGLADGDPVDAWPDSSGSGHDGAQSSPHQPIYRTNISGGLPAVEFGGAQDIDIAGFGDILSGDDTYTLAILNHPTGSFGNYPIMLTWPTNTIWQWIVEYDTSSGVYWGHTNGSFRLYTTATGIDTWPILALTKTVAADGTFRQSGTDITAYSTNGSGMVATPTMTGPVRMGGYYDHTFSFTGHIAEVIYYSKVLSPTDLAKVEGYLAWKWGRVGDLPGGHTYKTAPPTTAATGAVVTTGESATPATVAAAATISAPAISAGQRSLPATVPATAAVAGPATTTATGGTAHPATVTASTTAATPTVATGSRAVPLTFLATTAVPAPTVHIGTSMVPATVELLAAIGDPGVVTVTVAHITTPVFAVAVGSGRSAAPVAVSAVGAAVAANGRGGVNVDPSSTGSVLSGDGRTLAEVS